MYNLRPSSGDEASSRHPLSRGILRRLHSLGLAIAATGLLCIVASLAPATADADLAGRVAALEAELAQSNNDASVRRGAKIFRGSCAACHGRNGVGDGPGASELNPPPRDLSSHRYRFRTTPTGSMPRPEDLERSIREGLPGSSMPAFGRLFSDGEVADLIAFIYSLRPEGFDADDLPAPVVLPQVPAASPQSVQDGRALYLALGCWRCHGVNGAGNGPQAKGLTDETDRPIRSTNFRHDPFKGGRQPEDLVRTLLTGLNGSPMPAYGEAMMIARDDTADTAGIEKLSADDLQNVERFLAASPSREALAGMDDTARIELRDRRLAALAHYMLSLDRRHRAGSRLFHQQPELERRAP